MWHVVPLVGVAVYFWDTIYEHDQRRLPPLLLDPMESVGSVVGTEGSEPIHLFYLSEFLS